MHKNYWKYVFSSKFLIARMSIYGIYLSVEICLNGSLMGKILQHKYYYKYI